jgi:D-tyrosyl-tRNA(Tyr) deacylase
MGVNSHIRSSLRLYYLLEDKSSYSGCAGALSAFDASVGKSTRALSPHLHTGISVVTARQLGYNGLVRGRRTRVKAVIQRVRSATVSVESEVIGSIGRGLVVLVGVAVGDTEKDADYLARKAVEMRIFEDGNGKFNLSALDIKGEILAVSQFTLLADTRKGRRPSFTGAAPPGHAATLFEEFVAAARASGLKVATGRFQAHMLVEIHNDGPVTIVLDSREKLTP